MIVTEEFTYHIHLLKLCWIEATAFYAVSCKEHPPLFDVRGEEIPITPDVKMEPMIYDVRLICVFFRSDKNVFRPNYGKVFDKSKNISRWCGRET